MTSMTSRKFILAVFFALSSFGLALYDKLTPEYISLVTLVLGVYGAANVIGKRNGGT